MIVHHNIKFPRFAVSEPWAIPALCAAYGFPTNIAKVNTKPIGIISFGGTYSASDMEMFCAKYNIPVPTVTQIGTPYPSDPNGANVENMLDTETIAAVYPYMTRQGANIRLYWAQDFDTTIEQAAADGCSMLSCSWGNDESLIGAIAAKATNQAISKAVAMGMGMTAAAGDNDSSDGGPTPANVDYPGSCPMIICCGGTSKPQGGPEVVWNNNPGKSMGSGTGGGYSTIFPFKQINQPFVPPQTQVNINAGFGSGRMVPDVAFDADPNTGVEIVVGGQWIVIGGTSEAAPAWAGFLGAIDCPRQGMKMKIGNHYKTIFTDIVQGDNGTYGAAIGPDPCSGYGTPIGQAIYDLLIS